MTLPAVTIPYTFAAESGNQPAIQLDDSFGELATFINNLYQQTSAESLASVTPSNYYAPVGASWSYISRYNGSLAQGLAVAGVAPYTLYIDTPITVAQNLTVPASCALIFIGAGTIAVSGGFTLTITGPIFGNQANTSLFTGAGNVTISTGQSFYLGGQLLLSNATGGYQGSGTINAQGLYVNGSPVNTTGAAVYVTTTETKTNLSAFANSAYLISAIASAGTYRYELYIGTACNGATNAGLAANINYSGTFTALSSFYTVLGTVGGTTFAGRAYAVASSVTTVSINSATNSNATVPSDNLFISGMLTATGAGTLGFSWEVTGSPNTTSLYAGSYMVVTPL